MFTLLGSGRSGHVATTLAVASILLFATIGQHAFADNVVNNVETAGAGQNDTFIAGGSTTIGYRIVATGGDSQSGCNTNDGTPATVTINAPSGVTATPDSLSFNYCGNPAKNVVFTSVTPGSYLITVGVSDTGTGTYNLTPATFTLHVLSPPDSTAPNITYTINGIFPPAPDGSNGWYTTDAFLDWTVEELESPSSLVLTGCVDAMVDYDTAGETFSCEATSDGGSSGPVEVVIKRDSSAPELSYDLVPVSPDGNNGWYVSDINLSWTFGDSISGINSALTTGCVNQLLDTDFAMTSFACSVTNNAGLTSSDSVDLKRDATEPSVNSLTVSDLVLSEADAGNTFTVTVTYSEEMDGGFVPGITFDPDLSSTLTALSTGSWTDSSTFSMDFSVADANVEVDDVDVQASGAKDMAGNIQVQYTGTDKFDIDTIAPTVSGSTSATTHNGWYNAPITIVWSSPDTDDTCDSDTIYSGPDGTGFYESGSCTDDVGNVGIGSFGPFDFDNTDPYDLEFSNGPLDGESYYFGFVPLEPTCTADDASSPPAECTVNGYGSSVGQHTMTADAQDQAGNTASISRTYEVLAWDLYGFYNPVEMDGVFNVIKGGQTVPLKFEIHAGVELTYTSYVESLKYKKIACPSNGDFEPIEGDALSSGGTVLRYDADAGQFIYNWKTPIGKNVCWEVTLTTDDGSQIAARFQTK